VDPPSPPTIGLDLRGLTPTVPSIATCQPGFLTYQQQNISLDPSVQSSSETQQTLELFLSLAEENLRLIQATQAEILRRSGERQQPTSASPLPEDYAVQIASQPSHRPLSPGLAIGTEGSVPRGERDRPRLSSLQASPESRRRPRALTFGRDSAPMSSTAVAVVSPQRWPSQRSVETRRQSFMSIAQPPTPPSRHFIDTRSRVSSTHRRRRAYSCRSDTAFSERRSVSARPHSWIDEVRGCLDGLAQRGGADDLASAMAEFALTSVDNARDTGEDDSRVDQLRLPPFPTESSAPLRSRQTPRRSRSPSSVKSPRSEDNLAGQSGTSSSPPVSCSSSNEPQHLAIVPSGTRRARMAVPRGPRPPKQATQS